jgi:hypothetical protein
MSDFKKPGEPLWGDDHNNEPLWDQSSNFNDPANPFNKPAHHDPFEEDPNGPFAFLNDQNKKKKAQAKQPDETSKSDQPKDKTEPDATDLFGVSIPELQQRVGSAHSGKEDIANQNAEAATSHSDPSRKANPTENGKSPEPVTDGGGRVLSGITPIWRDASARTQETAMGAEGQQPR